MEVHALRERGWSISAIARNLDRDRKMVRAYVNGDRVPGVRVAAGPDPLEPFAGYVAQRFTDDPHVWATVLFDEVVELGFNRSYQSFTRLLRARGLRPHCEACSGVTGRATIEIEHPPGEEILCGVPHRISYVEPANMRRGRITPRGAGVMCC